MNSSIYKHYKGRDYVAFIKPKQVSYEEYMRQDEVDGIVRMNFAQGLICATDGEDDQKPVVLYYNQRDGLPYAHVIGSKAAGNNVLQLYMCLESGMMFVRDLEEFTGVTEDGQKRFSYVGAFKTDG